MEKIENSIVDFFPTKIRRMYFCGGGDGGNKNLKTVEEFNFSSSRKWIFGKEKNASKHAAE